MSTIITGTPLNDALNGTTGADLINAGAGNDVVNGNGGNDNINGAAGDDIVHGVKGNDTLVGGAGNDRLIGGGGNDQIHGDRPFETENRSGVPSPGAGNDILIGGRGRDSLYGGGGNDKLKGGDGRDFLDGGDGNDYLDGGADNDRLEGGRGNDTLMGGAGNDVLIGESGDDRLQGGTGSDTYIFYNTGNEGNDIIVENKESSAKATDVVRLSGTIKTKDVLFFRQGNDLVMGYKNSNNTVTMQDYFAGRVIERFEAPSSGQFLDFNDINNIVSQIASLSGGATYTSMADFKANFTAMDSLSFGWEKM
jgi:Ca2+-binding RTX toxin-like protein